MRRYGFNQLYLILFPEEADHGASCCSFSRAATLRCPEILLPTGKSRDDFLNQPSLVNSELLE